MNPRRHPDLRLKLLAGGRKSLGGVTEAWFEASPQALALLELCDGDLDESQLAERLPVPGASPELKRILVRSALAVLERRGLVVRSHVPPSDPYFESYGDPAVHRIFVSDSARTDLYRLAILELVRPGDVVIDVGTGTGILAMFAAQAGASVVHAIEPSAIAPHAERLVRANGFDAIQVHAADAAQLTLNVEADVILADWIGHAVVMERIFPAVAFQRDRCLKPGGRMFPGSVDLCFAPLSDPELRASGPEFWVSRPYGLDLSLLRDLEYEARSPVKRAVASDTLISAPQTLRSFDARTLDPSDLHRFRTPQAVFTVERDADLDGFCCFFRAQLSPSHVLDTGPGSPETFYGQQVFRVPPTPARAGDRLSLALELDEAEFRLRGGLRGGRGEQPFEFAYPFS